MSKKQVRLTLQEGAQNRPWYSYKYGKRTAGKRKGDPEQQPESSASADKRQKSAKTAATETATNVEPTSSTSTTKHSNIPTSTNANSGSGTTAASTDTDSNMAEEDPFRNEPMDMDEPVVRDRRSAHLGGNKGGSMGTSGPRGSVRWPDGITDSRHATTKVYTKQYMFRLQSVPIQTKLSHDGPNDYRSTYCRFPIYEFPYTRAGFCLSKEELLKIFQECTSAEVEQIEIEIYNKTAQLPFLTQQSHMGIGNNNIGAYIMQFRHDINKYRKGIITSSSLITNRCWGEHLSTIDSNNSEYVNSGVNHLSAEVVLRDWDLRFEFVHFHQDRPKTAKNRRLSYNEHIFPWRQFCVNYRNATFEEGLYDKVTYKPKAGMFHCITANSEDNLSTEIACARSPRHRARQNGTLLGMTKARHLAGASYNTLDLDYPDSNKDKSELIIPSAGKVFASELDLAGFRLINDDIKDVPVASIGFSPLFTGDLNTSQGTLVDMQMEVLVVVKTTIKEYRSTSYQYKFGGSLVQPDPAFGRMILGKYDGEDLAEYLNSDNTIPPYKDCIAIGATKQRIPPPIDISYNSYLGQSARHIESDIIEIEDIEQVSSRDNSKSGYNLRKRRMKLSEGNIIQTSIGNQAIPSANVVSFSSPSSSAQSVVASSAGTQAEAPVAKPVEQANVAKKVATSVKLTLEQKQFMAKLTPHWKDYNKAGYYTVLVAPSTSESGTMVLSKIPNPWASDTTSEQRKRRHAMHHMFFPPPAPKKQPPTLTTKQQEIDKTHIIEDDDFNDQ